MIILKIRRLSDLVKISFSCFAIVTLPPSLARAAQDPDIPLLMFYCVIENARAFGVTVIDAKPKVKNSPTLFRWTDGTEFEVAYTDIDGDIITTTYENDKGTRLVVTWDKTKKKAIAMARSETGKLSAFNVECKLHNPNESKPELRKPKKN